MPDKYDKAIEYLTANPDHIVRAWSLSGESPACCLFRHTEGYAGINGVAFGCLTQIRSSQLNSNGQLYVAPTEGLTEEIRADTRLPKSSREITLAHLPIFAEWQ